MNNIYKVIWSKAKNCYVVASEIAKSHTKSASGSEKMGGYGKRALLALAAASAIFCGGLVNVGASVQSETISAGTTSNPVLTVDNTDDATQLNKVISVAKEDKLVTKDNISGQLTDYAKASDLSAKADANDVYSRTDAENTFATKTELGSYATRTELDAKADKTALDGKADRTYVDQKLTEAGNNVETKLENYATKTEVVDKIAAEATARDTAINTAITLEREDRNAAIGNAINGEVAARNQAINTAIELEATKRDAAVANAKTDLQHNITAEETARKEADTAFNIRLTTAEGKIGANETAIGDLKAADTALEGKITKNREDIATLNGKVATAEGNITDLKAKDTDLEKKIQTNSKAIADTNKRTGGIARNLEDTQTTIEGSVKVDNKGNVKDVNELSAKKITTTEDADLKGDVTLGTPNGTNTVTVNGTANFHEAVNMDKGLNVTNGETNLGNTTVTGDLKVTGTITTDKMVFGDPTTNNYTEIDHGKVTSTNLEVRAGQAISSSSTFDVEKNEVGFGNGITGEQSSHKQTSDVITDTVKNNNTGDQSFHKQTSDIIMDNVKDLHNSNNRTQTKTETKDIITDKDGNSSTTSQTASENKTYLKDKDGKNTNSTIDTAKGYDKTIKGENGETSTKQDELNITNTAQNGTIKNDAQNIVNNASGNITNKANTMDTNVTGKATESYGELDTTVTGAENHTVTGKQTNTVGGGQENIISGGQTNNITGDQTTTITGNKKETVTENVTEDYKKDLTTTVGGNETHEVKGTKTETVEGKLTENFKGGQETNVTGDQDITVSGTQTTTATDINRNASSGMIDTIDNDYGTNTETKVAGKTTTDVSIKGTGEKGQYIRGANESRDYLIKGTLKNSETKTAEATSTKITDGNGKTSSTIQDVTQISGSVTDGTNTSVSNVKANSIDSAVTDGSSISTINQKKNSITSQVTDGTTITKTEQDTKNITNTAKDGTITNDAKDIVNNASGNMTNTVGGDLTTTVSGNELHEVTGKQTNKIDGDQENTIGGNQTTTVTGDISNKAENITNEANTKLTDKVGENTRVLDSDGITDTVGGSTFKQRIDKIMMESKDVSIKAEETLTNEAKVITNKASEVINNEAVNINNTATGIITSKASEIKNQADKLISNKVGENTWENMENGKITTSIKDGAKQNLTQSDAAGTTQSTVDGAKSTVTIQNADGLTGAVTDGRNTSVQNQTASAIATDVKDGAGNENASVANATTSANTITNGTKANTVISTADGTSFINSEAAAPVTGASGAGTAVNTKIKGNTITTGKVTMDYADVMKDLGVHGNAKVDQNLEVGGTSTLKGDVTMESNATVKKDLTVEGTTTTKTLKVTEDAEVGRDLSVGGNATIRGDVTANSYKVGDKTYISAAGINANDQKITNVADGSISEGSKDAVNGGQLYGVKRDLEHQVDKVGANAAAMANLRPMEFDPSSKWNIAAAIGNYGSETAAAIGAFYRPNDNVMVNLSTAFGTGENMVGGGVSVRLGKSGNKLSREESNALKDQVNDLTARMDALLSVLNPNMSKDFPDVPENHWAYEAVSRLAGNDIVQGYPDGEFHGERTMTRYEMAEIIYNALSRGAEAEKELVEEFKPELQAMAASEKATAERAEG